MAAGDTFAYWGSRFLLGQTGGGIVPGAPAGSYAIWDGLDPNPDRAPLVQFPLDVDGWNQAWSYFSHWEPYAQPAAQGSLAQATPEAQAWAQAAHVQSSPETQAWEPAAHLQSPPEAQPWAQAAHRSHQVGPDAWSSPPVASNPWLGSSSSMANSASAWNHAAAGQSPVPQWSGLERSAGSGGVLGSVSGMSRRGKVLAAAGTALVLVAGGLFAVSGVVGSGAGGRQVLLAAYSATTGARTADVSMSGTIGMNGDGMKISLTIGGSGQMDFGQNLASFTLSMGDSGSGSSSGSHAMTEIVDGSTVYEQMPQASGSTGAKQWVSTSPSDWATASSPDSSGSGGTGSAATTASCLSQLDSSGSPSTGTGSDLGSMDPNAILSELQSVSNDVSDQGTESVDGVSATHYSATIDPLAAIKSQLGPDCATKLQGQLGSLGMSAIPIDVWVDGSNRVVREQVKMSIKPSASVTGGKSIAMDIDFTMDFSNYGTAVDITPPPPSQVESMTDYLNQMDQSISSAQSAASSA